MQRGPMPPSHMQGNPSSGMGHPMGAPPYAAPNHRNMSAPQSHYHSGMPQPSPARQGNFNPMAAGPPPQNNGYPTHPPPLHSPHQQQMHMPPQRQMQHRPSIGMSNGMPYEPMRQQNVRPPQQFMQQQQQPPPQQPPPPPPPPPQQNRASQNPPNVMAGGWQSENDTPHRREMIQRMYVELEVFYVSLTFDSLVCNCLEKTRSMALQSPSAVYEKWPSNWRCRSIEMLHRSKRTPTLALSGKGCSILRWKFPKRRRIKTTRIEIVPSQTTAMGTLRHRTVNATPIATVINSALLEAAPTIRMSGYGYGTSNSVFCFYTILPSALTMTVGALLRSIARI